MNKPFDAEPVLQGLKDFQRTTVEYAFQRMFLDSKPTRRFLVADEVGLGKTLVAKGLVAKAIEHLQNKVKRVDIIYVCSNADIATQNVQRLQMPGLETFAKATRLTLLPLETDNLKKHKINFISFTPGTTFDHGNRGGMMKERVLIYQMLKSVDDINHRGLLNALQVTAGDGWFTRAEEPLKHDTSLADKYRADVLSDKALMNEIEKVAARFHDRRKTQSLSHEDKQQRLHMVSQLRKQLAKSCLDALEPDLVILDEFQRFRELLSDPDNNPSAELAHSLFNHSDELRILLLSATPYKMYAADAEEEDHYKDFIHTMDFLMEEPATLQALEVDLKEFRTGLLGQSFGTDITALQNTRERVEKSLLRFMCRTERVGKTIARDAMVMEKPITPTLQASDLHELRLMASLGNVLGESDNVEYWKSSPYLLNFMKDYQFKKAFDNHSRSLAPHLADILTEHTEALLHERDVDRYEDVNPGNARLRALWNEIDEQQLWKLLWIPPSLPYWQPQGSYANVGSISKQLIFSSWSMVPDAIASMLSYMAERRLMQHAKYKGNYKSMPQRFSQRLRFAMGADGKPASMTTLLLLYPSPTLARFGDPLTMIAKDPSVTLTLDQIRQSVKERIRLAIEPLLKDSTRSGAPDRRWYWIAIARLDARHASYMRAWSKEHWLTFFQNEKEGLLDYREILKTDATLLAHVEQWHLATEPNVIKLGPVPDDITDVITDIALGGHAICALRSLGRHSHGYSKPDSAMLNAATHISQGLRSQFNLPTTVALLHQEGEDDAYWQRVLRYGLDGNLQALLDEYAHQLRESLNIGHQCDEASLKKMADEMVAAMSLRTSTLRPDAIRVEHGVIHTDSIAMRNHFALRFGEVTDESGAVKRKEVVRQAFNSPFRPFVLASTSVGQEGLDFHTWCHSIIHWNLPSNPVDLEQREGRVHRYKGYAVRKNIARDFRNSIKNISAKDDPWSIMFDHAIKNRHASSNDLVPYWIYESEGGDSVQRRVFSLPFSKDDSRYRRLRKSLSLYRLVFAQPRQEDLLGFLSQTFGDEEAKEIVKQWRICLEPPEAIA